MTAEKYAEIKNKLCRRGYAEEILSVDDCLNTPCTDWAEFLREYVWVVINSGMKNQIAEKIFKSVWNTLCAHEDISKVFRHELKIKAIREVESRAKEIFEEYQKAEDKLTYLDTLPHIGPITKYHLARNLGVDCCKPDRHLERIAKMYNTDPHTLCKKLSEATGDKVGVVDVVLWRAGNLGII
jgi:hypothetical protein